MTQTPRLYEGMPIPQCWTDFEDVINSGINKVILYGPPGTGKTYGGLTVGNVGQSVERLICSDDMTNADVSGAVMPNETGGFEFHKGSVLRGWLSGSRIVVDEIDRAGGDVAAMLLAFLDSSASASFRHPFSGEEYRPADGFSAIMTSNIEDPDDLPPALKDRFPIAIKIDAAHPAALMGLPVELRALAATLVAGQPGQRASLRAFEAFEQLRKSGIMDTERAARMVFKHLADPIIESLRVGTLTPELTFGAI
jgi:hypothetical protein